jgi:UDP-2,3-diacylglucosamine pyrophosphatase LpxH
VKTKLKARAIFLSDIHLGIPESKAVEVTHFLKGCSCEKLVLNGDIIDAWALRRNGRWTQPHTAFIRAVLKKMEKEGTEIIYLRGNHDDILSRFLPFQLHQLQVLNEYIHKTERGDYLVVHGDGFDHVTTNHVWIAKLGSVGYDCLLRLNRFYDGWRRMRGKQPFSLSAWVKARVKQAVAFTGRYEEQLQTLARERGCIGIICGHIHTAANKQVGDVHYLNSGDWVESLTGLMEYHDGSMEIITYADFCERTGRKPRGHQHAHEEEDLDEAGEPFVEGLRPPSRLPVAELG